MRRNTEYMLAGALALYIVFFTRPAPRVVTGILSSPIAQIAALAGVIYVGATQSLVVAVVLALALVLSTPVREYMTTKKEDDKKKDEKKETKEEDKGPKSTPKLMKATPPKEGVAKASEEVSKKATPAPSKEEPKPQGQALETKTGGKTESFTNYAPF